MTGHHRLTIVASTVLALLVLAGCGAERRTRWAPTLSPWRPTPPRVTL
jgi:hypothetical protein